MEKRFPLVAATTMPKVAGSIRRISIDDTDVIFSLDDDVSRRWFGRYPEGELHEPRLTKLLWTSLKSAAVFVDVGAFLGYYTCIACKATNITRVYGFEIDPKNYQLLARNLALNACTNVEIHNVGVASGGGSGRYMKGSDPFGAAHRLSKEEEQPAGKVLLKRLLGRGTRPTPQLSLDSFFHEKSVLPDVVKIDVEGAELEVLQGMEELIARAAGLEIFIEIHPGAMRRFYGLEPGQVLRFLFDRGFRCAQVREFRTVDHHDTGLVELCMQSELEQNSVILASKS